MGPFHASLARRQRRRGISRTPHRPGRRLPSERAADPNASWVAGPGDACVSAAEFRDSVVGVAGDVSAGRRSAVEVAAEALDRLERRDKELGAFLEVSKEAALDEASQVDARIEEGEHLPLAGVPLAIKDNMWVAGRRVSCASRILEGFRPPGDATAVARLRAAGAVFVGKTNLDEFAMGSSTENSAFQITRNPWDLDRIPGGSSGGSAAAVAARIVPGALGSDTGGSIRQPGACCGVVGFKPTYGRCSRYGLVAFGSSLDQIGPMAKSVEDVALCASCITGHDPLDSTSLPDSKISVDSLKDGSLRGLKVALPKELFGKDMQEGVLEQTSIAIDTLKKEGVEFHEVSIPAISLGVTTYYIIAPAEASSNLAR